MTKQKYTTKTNYELLRIQKETLFRIINNEGINLNRAERVHLQGILEFIDKAIEYETI